MDLSEDNLIPSHVYLSQTSPVMTHESAYCLTYASPNQLHESFEHNQSCPVVPKTKATLNMKNLENFNGENLNSYNYTSCGTKNLDLNSSLNSLCGSSRPHSRVSNGLHNFLIGANLDASDKHKYNTLLKNPHKAVFIFDTDTSKILTTNREACRLFGLSSLDLIGQKISSLFNVDCEEDRETLLEDVDLKQGNVVVISGKVLEAVDSNGTFIPVSVWARRIEGHSDRPRCIIILEPVEQIIANFSFNNEGFIANCDDVFAYLHHCNSPNDVIGVNMRQLVTNFEMPLLAGSRISKGVRLQRITSTAHDGETFPATVCIRYHEKIPVGQNQTFSDCEDEDDNGPITKARVLYHASMWVFTGISGLLTCRDNGSIHSVNTNFALNLLGCSHQQLQSQSIFDVLPSLADDITCANVYNSSLPLSVERKKPDSLETTPVANNGSNRFLFQETPCQDEKYTYEKLQKGSISPINNLLMGGASALPANKKQPDVVTSNHSASSWVEVTMNNQSPMKEDNNHYDSITKINLLLNGSLLNGTGDQEKDVNRGLLLETSRKINSNEFRQGGAVNGSPDSAVHSALSGQTSKTMLKPTDAKCSPRSSFSDYYSGQDSPHVHAKVLDSSYVIIDSHVDKTADADKSTDKEKFVDTDKLVDHNPENSTDVVPTNEYSIITIEKSTSHDAPDEDFPSKEGLVNKFTDRMSGDVTSTPLDSGLRRQSKVNQHLLYNTDHTLDQLPDGCYQGQARHNSGKLIGVSYTVVRLKLADDSILYCFWISRDQPLTNNLLSLTMRSSFNCSLSSLSLSKSACLDSSLGSMLQKAAQEEVANRSEVHIIDDTCMEGEVGEKYSLVKKVGNGAFGFVQAARHKLHGKEVVIKFIVKEKILDDCWVDDFESDSKIPMEISLLLKLNHKNIIKVLEFFENEQFFSVVMRKHGRCGIDLFEFIDRSPKMDEPLSCYIFRQIASAVDYLHKHSILHRDVKDENVIIDENFNCKLIDFGSATFLRPGEMFSAFCGTIEYCSPEVLIGDEYAGPELEMWSMGVTLYTLVFGENPFHDVNETIEGVMRPPYYHSKSLMNILSRLLHPDPYTRCKMKELLEHPWINQPVDVAEYSWKDVVPPPQDDSRDDIDAHQQARKEVYENSDDDDTLSSHESVDPDDFGSDEENICTELKRLAMAENAVESAEESTKEKNISQKRQVLSPLNTNTPLNNTF